MALHAEELQAQKTTEEVGSVNLRKDVVEEQKSIDVPVTREEVQVRRTPVDRPADTRRRSSPTRSTSPSARTGSR